MTSKKYTKKVLKVKDEFYLFPRNEIIERKIKPEIPKLEVRKSAVLFRELSPRNPSS